MDYLIKGAKEYVAVFTLATGLAIHTLPHLNDLGSKAMNSIDDFFGNHPKIEVSSSEPMHGAKGVLYGSLAMLAGIAYTRRKD